MIITTNIFALPLVIAVWVLDCACLLITARFAACRLSPGGKLARSLVDVTEPVLAWANQVARRITGRSLSSGILACIVVLAGLFVRQAIIAVLR